jgi:hypothetical protein
MADNAVLASLMARPEGAQYMTSVADMMRNRALAQQQIAASQQQISASQTGQQLTQQQVQELRLRNQMEQIDLQNQQAWGKYYENPDQSDENTPKTAVPTTPQAAGTSLEAGMSQGASSPVAPVQQAPVAKPTFAEDMLGLAQDDPLAKMTNAAIRMGVNPTVGQHSAMSMAQGLLSFRANILKQTADKQAIVKNGLEEVNKILAPIGAETDDKKRAAMLQSAEPELQKASVFDPSLHQSIMQADPQHIDKIINLTGGMQNVLEYGTKQAQQLEAKQKTAVPETTDRQIANQTISTYNVLPEAMRAAFQAEINQAPTIAAMEKIQARADEAYKSEQMKIASLAQAKSLQGNKFGEAGLTANEKIWSDPQHGFAAALAQARQTKQSIVAGAEGNGLITSMVPTMEVLGINHAAGISRISPQEAQAAQLPGGWREQWNAWATKAATGKISPELAKEGQELMDVVIGSAHQRALTSSQLIAQGHGIAPDQTPAMDKDGNVTTLDKAMQSMKPSGLTEGKGKVLDRVAAQQFYEAAGRDPAKARALAIQHNWKVQ